jgi:flagellar hook protein FlgE
MEKALIAAVTGIEANQTYLDVIGNNIANSDTTGYKSSDAVFTDLLAEQIAGATAPGPSSAGVNPVAVGSGVRVGAVTDDLSQGSLQQTNEPTDIAIQGNGFLVANQNGTTLFTRAGHLQIDANGNLSTPTGGLIQGWQADSSGNINSTGPTSGVVVPTGEVTAAVETTQISMSGNLPEWTGSGTAPVVSTTINAYDALGDSVPTTLTFTGVASTANEWTMQATVPKAGGGTQDLFSTPPTVTFDATNGQIKTISGVTQNSDGSWSVPVGTMPPNPPYNFQASDTWKIQFPASNSAQAVTQYSGATTLKASGQDGSSSGTLESFSIGEDGVITGSFSNGRTQGIAQIALAIFANSGGLASQGNLMYSATPNSGQASVGPPNSSGRGSLIGGSLESSNVNLATQLTDLVEAQEAYQANTKVIATTATVLQALSTMP